MNRKEYMIQWWKDHPDYAREWRRNNSEKVRDIKKRTYEKHIDKNRQYARDYYQKNGERCRAYTKSYYQKNKDKIRIEARERIRLWRQANPERAKEIHAKSVEKKKEKYSQYHQEYSRGWHLKNKQKINARQKKWRQENRDIKAAQQARRRCLKRSATPSWADKEKMLDFYRRASRLTKETGIKHVVDHIIPLKSKYVCGLHVETNLQVIPFLENAEKINRFSPIVGIKQTS